MCSPGLSTAEASAQRGQLEYAFGMRVGNGVGISVQYFHTNKHVFENYIFNQWKGYSITSLYEHHQQIYDVKGLKWYAGAGAHINIFPNQTAIPDQYATVGRKQTVPGLDGIIGLEYYFRYLPLQLSVDWKPEYNFVMGRPWYFFNSAMSIRYRI